MMAALLLSLTLAAAADLESAAVAAIRRLLIDPLPSPCRDVRMVGGKKKYPKAVCFDHFPISPCTVLAVGARKPSHMGFDFHMARKHRCEVHSFDPFVTFTNEARVKLDSGLTFHKVGLAGGGGMDAAGNKFDSLTGIFKLAGGAGGAAVLKVDCEGCEWEALDQAAGDPAARALLGRVGQISMELHFEDQGPTGFNLTRLQRTFSLLDDLGFCPFAREGHKCALRWAPCSPPNRLFKKHFRAEPTVHHPSNELVRSWWELAWIRLPPGAKCNFRHWVN
eukprot:Hpha_TRINITY_DN16806_c0_g1::TRINITY_DN16806_c0_g1_i1::g.151855::m.151855